MMTAPTIHEETITQTRIKNPQVLRVLRLLWGLAVSAALIAFFSTLPYGYMVLRDSPRMGAGYAEVLSQLGISREAFAAFFVITEIIMLIPPAIFSIIVVSQRSNDWLALLVSATLILTSITAAFTTQQSSFIIGGSFFTVSSTLIFTTMLVFPDGQFQPPWSRYLLPIVIPIFALGGFLTSRVMGGQPLTLGQVVLTGLAESVTFLGLLAQVYRYQRIATPLQRQQTKWLIVGGIIFMLVAYAYIVSQLFPALRSPVLFPTSAQYTLGSLITLFIFAPLIQIALNFIPISVALAVVRYRLWNIDIVVNRSLVYAFQTVMLIIIFGLIFFLIRVFLGALLGNEQDFVAVGIGAAVVAGMFNPVRQWSRRTVDRYVFGLRFDLDELHAAHNQPEITKPGSLTGKILDGYEVLDVIGKGGMGEVYKGFSNGQTVAIKTLLLEIAQEQEMRERFHREAEIGKALHHPHIVKVFASGEIEGTPYMVMEYVEGQDLREYLKAGERLDEETATQFMQHICAALDTAHQKGFVHRDLKPANIMIKANGEAVLMDFGVTKMVDTTSNLTGTGAIGTIDYMAPEQITSSRTVDYHADIYALGVMLYELMTGEKPFSGGPAQVMFAHLQQPPPDPRDINDDIPRPIAKAIIQAMAKKPEDRFHSAGEFAQALRG